MSLNGGGILVNWGCYDLDYMVQVMGWKLKPKEVMAHWWPVAEKTSAFVVAGSDAESHYTAFVQCEDDVVISIERGEFPSSQTDMAWQIMGADASLCLPMRPTNDKKDEVILNQFRPGDGVVSRSIWTEADTCLEDDVIHDFARAIRDGFPPKICSAYTENNGCNLCISPVR